MHGEHDFPVAFAPVLAPPDCSKCHHLQELHRELIGGIQGTRRHCFLCLKEGGPCT